MPGHIVWLTLCNCVHGLPQATKCKLWENARKAGDQWGLRTCGREYKAAEQTKGSRVSCAGLLTPCAMHVSSCICAGGPPPTGGPCAGRADRGQSSALWVPLRGPHLT